MPSKTYQRTAKFMHNPKPGETLPMGAWENGEDPFALDDECKACKLVGKFSRYVSGKCHDCGELQLR